MAKIWPVYDGSGPTLGEPWANLPVPEVVHLLEIAPNDFVSDTYVGELPRFGDKNRDLWFLGYKTILVEIGRSEGRKAGWKPGFYRSSVKPKDAYGRLIKRAFAKELGPENVVRVEHESSTDSQGRKALRITVVLDAQATERFHNEASLNALVRLQNWLNERHDDRIPIVEYATEAELAQDAAP